MQLSDVLSEICKFSAMKATTALSQFLNIPIGVDMKLVEVKKLEDLFFLDNSESNTVSIFLPITGDLMGVSFFLFSEQAALSLCDVLFHRKEGGSQKISEPEISAISEVTNIVIGNFLTIFAQSLHMDMLMHRSPVFDCGPFNLTIQKRLPVLTESMKEAMLSISFGFQHVNIIGYVLIVFSEEKINRILKNINAPTNIE